MKENKLLEKDLSQKGFNLFNVNLNKRQLNDKKGFGIVQYQWIEKGSFNVVVRTGLKKDIIISDEYNENYKRLLLNSVENKRVPFFFNKNELEQANTSTGVYGIMYSLRENELKKVGNEGIRYNLWPKHLKNYDRDFKSVIECNFLYSEKKGSFYLGRNGVEFFLPKGESLRYYSKHLNRERYGTLLKMLKLVLNLVIINLEFLTVESIIELSKKEQQILLKRLMVLEWLLRIKINGLLCLLDNDSWAWRYNYYYLQYYINDLLYYLNSVKKFVLSIFRLNLDLKSKKLLVYRIQKEELKHISSLDIITYGKSLSVLKNNVDMGNLNQNYLINVVNVIFQNYLRFKSLDHSNKLKISKSNSKVKLHLVSSLDHFFKKSVVSVRSLRKLHKEIWRITKVRAIRGLLYQNEVNPKKDFYKVITGYRKKIEKTSFKKLKEKENIKGFQRSGGYLKVVPVKGN